MGIELLESHLKKIKQGQEELGLGLFSTKGSVLLIGTCEKTWRKMLLMNLKKNVTGLPFIADGNPTWYSYFRQFDSFYKADISWGPPWWSSD